MIIIETPRGLRHFTKAVFVWTGHVTSGWPTSFHTFVYNDPINGLITYGHDDAAPEVLTWFIPNGQVALGSQTVQSAEAAYQEFTHLYGNRVVVWVNHKEGIPMLSEWTRSEYVLRCSDLKAESFTGSTQAEFKEWADPILEKISGTDHIVVPMMV